MQGPSYFLRNSRVSMSPIILSLDVCRRLRSKSPFAEISLKKQNVTIRHTEGDDRHKHGMLTFAAARGSRSPETVYRW